MGDRRSSHQATRAERSSSPIFGGTWRSIRMTMPQRSLGLPRTTLNQHRPSYAVMQLKRGCDHLWLKNQLGHAPQSALI